MRKTALPVLACLSLVAACGNANTGASSPMKPGLWEVTVKSDAMKNAPKISASQAAQMRKMGIEVPDMGKDGMKTKVCYTKEMLAKNGVPGEQSKECSTQNMKQSGNSFSAETVCNGPHMKGTGTVNGTMTSTAFDMQSTFKGTVSGQAVTQRSQVSGAFLSDNC